MLIYRLFETLTVLAAGRYPEQKKYLEIDLLLKIKFSTKNKILLNINFFTKTI
jgi:hypothetical protein